MLRIVLGGEDAPQGAATPNRVRATAPARRWHHGGVARIVLLGPGAVGGLLAGALTRAGGEAVLVGRPGTVAAIARDGLRLQSPRYGDERHAVRAVERLELRGDDVLVVATKAAGLRDGLDRVGGTPAAVVPLLNGLDHVGVLRERFGDRVVAATIRVQAHREGPAHVVHRIPLALVTLAAPGCPPLVAALRAADVDVDDAGASQTDVLWGKLTRLCAIALATAAADRPLGDVREDARAVAREAAAVARADGAAVDEAAVLRELDELPDGATSSLRADVVAGAEHELDAIAGAVQRAARRHGLDVATVDRLSAAVLRRSSQFTPVSGTRV
ncbi:ketopantoate reductase family protein [Conexibacter sp. SYSU D00693]|uniref:ketopantoate reductase family protein n=1 Tax=Conexibacter sp. SYSU D00693 TaxID=2812560 RepID=UPI00196AA275|nr:ketopantoate reductase family protein [Conexibacter sp. SYSU D00693]